MDCITSVPRSISLTSALCFSRTQKGKDPFREQAVATDNPECYLTR